MQDDKLNKVMAIKIPLLEAFANNSQITSDYAFKDLHLANFGKAPSIATPYNTLSNTPLNQGTDITVDYDVQAILNSIYNLFNTSKGERYLFPGYGSDLQKHLFMPASDMTAQMLGTDIRQLIKDFEPRIEIVDLVVIIHDDNELEAQVVFVVLSTEIQSTMNIYVKGDNTPITVSLNYEASHLQ